MFLIAFWWNKWLWSFYTRNLLVKYIKFLFISYNRLLFPLWNYWVFILLILSLSWSTLWDLIRSGLISFLYFSRFNFIILISKLYFLVFEFALSLKLIGTFLNILYIVFIFTFFCPSMTVMVFLLKIIILFLKTHMILLIWGSLFIL